MVERLERKRDRLAAVGVAVGADLGDHGSVQERAVEQRMVVVEEQLYDRPVVVVDRAAGHVDAEDAVWSGHRTLVRDHDLGRPAGQGDRDELHRREPTYATYRLGMATEDDVRRIALGLPEVTEKPWYGSPGFRVKDKGFLRIRSEAEGALVVFVADLGEKEALLASDAAKFFTTPHYDGHPTVLVHLAAVDVDELTELITDAWLVKAPPKVRKDHPEVGPPD
ncbi:MmcQ/YjbR family DNA-binding protein [Aquihabitans daechungensis]|uniref:MmcQ/YjbR family DNA-binding protein n=1 Tax=Aquihabitans daechungensis TaxID=1052257 RepID=UPI003BA25A6A